MKINQTSPKRPKISPTPPPQKIIPYISVVFVKLVHLGFAGGIVD